MATAQVQAPPPPAPPSASASSSSDGPPILRTHHQSHGGRRRSNSPSRRPGSPRSARARRRASASSPTAANAVSDASYASGSGGGGSAAQSFPTQHPNAKRGGGSSSSASPSHQHQHHQHQHEYDDDGTPSTSLSTDLYRALHLIHDERHLVAYDLYRDVRGRVEELDKDYGVKDGGDDATTTAAASENGTGNNSAAAAAPHHRATGGLSGLASPSPRRGRAAGGAGGGGGLPFTSPLRRRTPAQNSNGGSTQSEEQQKRMDWQGAKGLLVRNEEEFIRLEKRAKLFLRAKQNLTIDDDWVKSQTLFGITTYYRREPDSSLSIKLEGHLSGIPLFEQLAVLREADLYHVWAPFCVASTRLAQLGKIDVVAWFLTGLPKFGLSRDACFRAVGCDSMREDGSIILVGEGLGDRMEDGVNVKPYLGEMTDEELRASGISSPTKRKQIQQQMQRDLSGSIHDSSNYSNWATLDDDEYEFGSYLSRDSVLDTLQLPPIPDKFGSGRMTIRSFQGVIDVLSPSSARTRIVTNIDPNLRFVPQTLIDYCMKKMCGVLLSRLQGTARGVLRDPVHSLHARRMREDAQFYRLWLLPKFRAYCEDLGWELPPVAAFNVSEEDLDEEEWLLYGQLNQEAPAADIRRVHSDGAVGVGAVTEGARAASVDGAPTGTPRRLFQTERQAASPRDRSVVSESALRQQQGYIPAGDGRTRTRLRQLLPADSMEVALTSPDLLKRWEQRQAKRKALEVASARRKAALRLKPAKPNEEQTKRLKELKEAKSRFLEGKKGGGSAATKHNDVVQRGAIETKGKNIPSNSILLEVVSFTHPGIPHKVLLPFMLMIMFVIYHADNGLIYRYVEPTMDEECATNDECGSNLEYVFKAITRNALFGLVLFLYAFIHWAVLNMALIVSFDFVELPLVTLAGTRTGLQNVKALYASNVRMITGYITLAIVALVLGSSLLSCLWSYIVLAASRIEMPKLTEIVASTCGAVLDRFGLYPNEKLASISSSVSRLVGNVTAPLRYITGLTTNALLRLWHFLTYGLFIGSGARTKDWISSGMVALSNAIFAVDADSFAWRRETVDKSKMLMSYSAAFMLSFVAIAHIVFPKEQKTRRSSDCDGDGGGGGGQETLVNWADDGNVDSGFNTEGMTRTLTSPSTFSLASGEIMDDGVSLQGSRSLAASPQSIDKKSLGSTRSRRQKLAEKFSSIRSV